MDELAANNPCIKFIVDNYDMLCRAHPGKTVLVIDDDNCISKIFASMVDAMMYTSAIRLYTLPYALVDCNGADLGNNNLLFSESCKIPN